MMAAPIVIRLDGEPVGKGRPRFVRETGHAYTPAHTRSYEVALRLAGQDAIGIREPLEGPLAVYVEALFPVPASWSKKKRAEALAGRVQPTVKPDADNLLKVLDALNEVVWRDDKQIVEAHVLKRYSAKPALVIEVLEAAPTRLAEAAPAETAALFAGVVT